MKIIKRDGSEVPFDYRKIVRAIEAANDAVAEEDRISDMQKDFIVGRIERRCDELGRSVSVEEIQDMVIDELDQAEAHKLARHYSDYRLRHELLRKRNSKFDRKAAVQQLNTWMKEDFGAYNIELHYSKIEPHIITCEEYLGEMIIDYKFFCFNGETKYIYVSSDLIHDRQAHIGFFYLDGKKMPLIRDDYAPMDIDELPPFFDNMKNDATILCQDFPFVRVDFFLANNTYYFAELTFTPSAGMMPFNPDKYDLEWGQELDISREMGKSK